LLMILVTPHTAYVGSNAFRIESQVGEWINISDFIVESGSDRGEARIKLYADDYRLGSWTISYDINIDVEPGGDAEGWIKLSIPELGLEVFYYEWYWNGGIEPDKIANNLTIWIDGEKVYSLYDSATEPFDSRLNMRMYMAIANVGGEVTLLVRDEYGEYGGGEAVFYREVIEYDGTPVTFTIEVYKNSEYVSSIEVPFVLNTPRDSIIFEEIELQTLDYSVNAIFSLSLVFLVGAITFNLLSARVRDIESTFMENETSGKKGKRRKKK